MPSDLSTFELIAAIIGLLIAIGTFVKIIIPFIRWCSKVGGIIIGGLEVIFGRAETIDPATGDTIPELLPLGQVITEMRKDVTDQGRTLDDQGRTLSDLTSVVKSLADQHVQYLELKHETTKNTQRLDVLEPAVAAVLAASAERAETAKAAAAALNLVRDETTSNAEQHPEETP